MVGPLVRPLPSRNGRAALTAGENMAMGGLGGTLETCLLMPLLTWKFTVQEGRALPTKLTHWYRGVVVQAANVAPITALQMLSNGVLERATTGLTGHGLTDGERIACAAGAGVISSVAYTPVDYICIHQGKTGLGVAATIAALSAEHGRACFWRGFNAMAVREAIYTAGYLGLGPVLTERLAAPGAPFEGSKYGASIAGACTAGTIAALLTHPVDTAKTMFQADAAGASYRSAAAAGAAAFSTGGVGALYRGGLPRTLRLCGAFFIVGSLRDYAEQWKAARAYEAIAPVAL